MLTAEPRAQRSLLERIVDGGRFLENVSQSDGGTTEQFRPENGLRGTVRDVGHLHALIRVVYIIELLGFDAGCLRSTGVRTAGHRHRRAKDAVRCGVIYNFSDGAIEFQGKQLLTLLGQGENFHGRHIHFRLRRRKIWENRLFLLFCTARNLFAKNPDEFDRSLLLRKFGSTPVTAAA